MTFYLPSSILLIGRVLWPQGCKKPVGQKDNSAGGALYASNHFFFSLGITLCLKFLARKFQCFVKDKAVLNRVPSSEDKGKKQRNKFSDLYEKQILFSGKEKALVSAHVCTCRAGDLSRTLGR